MVTPDLFRTVPCPTDPTIRLAFVSRRVLSRLLDPFAPDTIHIATEGPLGLAARAYCVRRQRGLTTSFHTKFPEYLNARLGLPVGLGYAALRWFHARSSAVMVATQTVRHELLRRAFPASFRGRAGSMPPCSGLVWSPPSSCLDRFFSMSDAYRRKRTCPTFSTSACQDQSWWSVTGHCCRCCDDAIRKSVSPAGKTAKHWFAIMPRPTRLFCRAGPRPLDWCCWRRSPAGFRSPHFQCRGRST
jgi:Glycosyltransferase Family 4